MSFLRCTVSIYFSLFFFLIHRTKILYFLDKIDHLSQVRVEFEQRLLRYNNITASVCVEEFVQVTNPPLNSA